MSNKYLILSAQAISLLFSPFYMPVVAFLALFVFSYMSLLPPSYKAMLLFMVWLFTVILPRLSIFTYRKLNGWTRHGLGRRTNRYVPYLLSMMNYALLLYLMERMHMPRFTLGIIAGALALQIVCAVLNNRIGRLDWHTLRLSLRALYVSASQIDCLTARPHIIIYSINVTNNQYNTTNNATTHQHHYG